MRHLEYKHQGSAAGRLFDAMCNALTVPVEAIVPLLAIQYGYGGKPAWSWWNVINLKAYTGKEANGALYQNGVIFLRVMFPFWVGIQVRYSETAYWQAGAGWKLIGRPAIHFRFQTDDSAQGGLAIGYMDGPK